MTSLPSTEFLAQYQLYADPDERLLICCRPECGFALSTARSQLTTHLRDKHGVSDALRQRLTHYLKHVHPYPFRDPAAVPGRPDGSPVHPKLQEYPGYSCRRCGRRTTNRLLMTRHISKEHVQRGRGSREEIGALYNDVFLQTWTYRAHGGDR